MKFNKNKTTFIHRWYPFVEGYSKEFITSILDELDYTPNCALEPFMGSGTTPLELQLKGIKCISFEVNPFMFLLSRVKLRRDYTYSGFLKARDITKQALLNYKEDIEEIQPIPAYSTITKTNQLEKWIFNENILKAILDIKHAISFIDDIKYRDLFRIALASILLDVSNVYRNGKCLSYKEDWEFKRTKRTTVHKIFLDKLTTVFKPDIIEIDCQNNAENEFAYCNFSYACFQDVRKGLELIEDNSIDLVITSPPYLNSRDYTDIYIIELWVLDLIKDYNSLRELRKSTLRSHVQVVIGEVEKLNINKLNIVLDRINKHKNNFWNKQLPNMISGYFKDMDDLFTQLYNKMKKGKKIYFNVANSAYYGVEIKVDEIIAEIAENKGFKVEEIRKARQLKVSSQQKDMVKSLRESVIVMSSN